MTCRRAELLPAVKTNADGTVVENRKYVYNESNQLSEAVLCDGKTTRKVQYTYDADGNLTGEYSPTDRSLTTYTVENRLEAVYTGTAYSQTEGSCGTCVYTYEYDLMGNNSSALSAISRLGQ